MAYRIKGILTIKQRRGGVEFIQDYYNLISGTNISEAERALVEGVFYPWVLMVHIALLLDERKIMEKITGALNVSV